MVSRVTIIIPILIAVASAGVVPSAHVYHSAPAAVVAAAPVTTYAAPASIVKVSQPVLAKADDEYDPHPQYKFSYDVQDSLSGDSKNQFEERDGDVVRGEYSLIDSDGFKRTVQYTSDPVNGFNAVVNREPLVKAVKTIAAPSTYAAPAVVKTVAPVTHYAAPAAIVKSVAPAYSTYAVSPAVIAHH